MKKLDKVTLSIVIPCYNERENIIKILDKIDQVKDLKKEIIVVDDCSTDGTRDILEEYVRDRVDKLVYHEHNGGKGAALKTGFSHASGDIVIVQDADLEYDPMEYTDVIRPIVEGKARVVYGSRFLASGAKGYLANRMANKFLTILSNLFTHQKLTDIKLFGVRLFSLWIFRRNVLGLSLKLRLKFLICASVFKRFRFHTIPGQMRKVRKLALKMG